MDFELSECLKFEAFPLFSLVFYTLILFICKDAIFAPLWMISGRSSRLSVSRCVSENLSDSIRPESFSNYAPESSEVFFYAFIYSLTENTLGACTFIIIYWLIALSKEMHRTIVKSY